MRCKKNINEKYSFVVMHFRGNPSCRAMLVFGNSILHQIFTFKLFNLLNDHILYSINPFIQQMHQF